MNNSELQMQEATWVLEFCKCVGVYYNYIGNG